MDVDDPCGNDSFYDEFDSYMPPPGDYNLDDIDEILRTTDTQLDSTLDAFNSFATPSDLYGFDIKNEYQPDNTDTRYTTYSTSPYEPKRSFSSSSTDGDAFNPDEFMNFLNDDAIKLEEFTRDSDCSSNDALPPRNTPSPTGSCSSSGGSSTSGIQSDASSVGSMTPAYVTQIETKSDTVVSMPVPLLSLQSTIPANVTTPTSTPATILQPLPQLLQGTLIPLKTLPIKPIVNVTAVKPPTLPAPVKAEPKLAPKLNNNAAAAPMKIVGNNSNNHNNSKLTSPPNAKPKTIFLSSNDFKALMQKMNSNGSKTGAKITGGINAQMPKIIMKTPNGKVITANKIVQPLNSANSKVTTVSNSNGLPKIVTTNAAQFALQQHQQQQQHQQLSQSSKPTNATNTTIPLPERSVYKGMIDERMLKKQQRMIKNRESASLSRKKKKEYVVSLEARINNLEKENYTLKGENKSLRSQLVAFAQTCHCKHSNISEFILNSLNAAAENKPQHVKIAPKPAPPRSIKQRMTAANVRKNVAILFAMAFMVTLNVGNFQHFLNKNTLETAIAEQNIEEPIPQVPVAAASGRRLLWVETEAEYNEKQNRSKRDIEMDVPPLHFLRPINRTGNGNATAATTASTTESTIMGSTNQTENLRLASNLRKWIGGNANHLNLSLHESFGNDELENPTGFKVTSDYYDMRAHDLPLQKGTKNMPQQKRKYYVDDEHLNYGNKQRKIDDDNGNENINDNEIGHSLDLFKPKISDEYLRLFKGIKRQDDTFYVLSFNMDHILLPAANYNKSSRPKMSLMLPAGDPSLNGDIMLMQIDCEVTNTTELMLKSYMIPEKLRPHKFTQNSNDVANNETAGTAQKPRERFYRPAASNSIREEEAQVKEKKQETANDKLMVKQKPIVRTYYLMGPKNQAAADAMKKKPTIIKLSGNETVVNGVLSMKNSTLFAKMRETVASETMP